jgi:hypothetical protein
MRKGLFKKKPFLTFERLISKAFFFLNFIFNFFFKNGRYLVDPASSHMLVSKIKPCKS